MIKKNNLDLKQKRKAISPLIAVILLIVVAVVIIVMVVSWGKGFTQEQLDIDVETTYNLSDYRDFVWYDKITGNTLQIKNLGDKSFEITGYKINSSLDSPYLNQAITLEEPMIVLNNNIGIIPLFCVPENEFTVEVITSDNTYFNIPVKNASHNISSCSLDFQITSPEDDSTFVLTQDINFSSEINKTLGDYTCSWDSNINGALSPDCDFTTSSLQEGTHLITLTVVDDFSQETQDITINIKDNLGAEITSPADGATFNHNDTITLVGSAINSYGDVTCSWSSNHDGSLGSGCTLADVSLSENTHNITLTVEDDLEEVTDSITLDVGSLSASILSPSNNSVHFQGNSISFTSSVDFPYQGTYTCSWDSNIDGVLSSNCSFTKNDLSLGTHEITLEVDDSEDTESTTINIVVNEPSCSGLPYIEFSGSYLCINTVNRSSNTNWSTAISYCNGLTAHTYSDWYLPTIDQLEAIWNVGSGTNASMNANINKGDYESEWTNISSYYYWSSTEYSSSTAYIIYMGNGTIYYGLYKFNKYDVRCVRDP
jgi:hypothetical protein